MEAESTKPIEEPAFEPQTQEFATHREQAWKDRQSSSDEFDKSLLTFSSGALGLSLAFIKDIVPLATATRRGLLYASWISFAVCIMATIFSYPPSMKAIDKHLDDLYKYYVEGKQEFLNPKNRWSDVVTILRGVGAFFFLAGVCITVLFVWLNLPKGH